MCILKIFTEEVVFQQKDEWTQKGQVNEESQRYWPVREKRLHEIGYSQKQQGIAEVPNTPEFFIAEI